MDLIQVFRWLAIAEGISYLAFGVTMPLKYGFGVFWPNQFVGLAHGFIFIAFSSMLLAVWIRYRWSLRRVAAFVLASLIPYGTIWLERRTFGHRGRS